MSHHPSSPVEYRIDPSLEPSSESGFLEGPGPSRPYRYTSAMPLSTPVSVPQTPLGPAFHGGFAPPYDAYTHHLSQENSRLSRENVELKIQLETTMKNYDMLLAKFDHISSHSNHPTCHTYKADPPLLRSVDYPLVRFWRRSAYDQFLKRGNGETDGLATTKPRRGRPSNDESSEKHPYLETKDGTPVDSIRLRTIGDRTRQHFTTFQRAKVAPPSWGQLDHDCFTYFRIEMYTEFEEFRYCEDHWKLNFWAQRKYTSWSQTVRKRQATSDEEPAAKKCKVEVQGPLLPSIDLDDPTLTTFDDLDHPAAPFADSEIPPLDALVLADPLNNIEFTGPSLTVSDDGLTAVIPIPSTSPGPQAAVSDGTIVFADPLNNIKFTGPSLTVSDDGLTAVIPTPSTSPGPQAAVSNGTDIPTPSNEATSAVSNGTAVISTPSNEVALADSDESDPTQAGTSTMQEVTNTISAAPVTPGKVKGKGKGKGKGKAMATVVGAGFTEKNFAMKQWLLEHPSGLKCDFDLYYRGLASTEKKVYNDQAKAARKAATAQKQREGK